MLGLFDSGLGGLTVLREVRARLRNADILYFADQEHVPYGDRSADDLRRLLRANVAWLNDRECNAIVMACNTSCAIANRYGWPESRAPIFDLIEAAASAVAAESYESIAVVATTATVREGAYARAIQEQLPRARVVEVAAPALVPLIESGAPARAIDAAVAGLCADLPDDLDALVYGCTHYPLVDDAFARALDARIRRLDPARSQAERVASAVSAGDVEASGNATTRFVTSGAPEPFYARLAQLGVTEARSRT
jgi:glutamate racemase